MRDVLAIIRVVLVTRISFVACELPPHECFVYPKAFTPITLIIVILWSSKPRFQMPWGSHKRRQRSASPTTYYSHTEYPIARSHHHGHSHRKHHHHSSTSTVDLLKTAASTLGEAVVTGIGDGRHHQHQHHYEDYDSKSIGALDSKTADQVYDTLLQAAYSLGEVVGDFERKFGINKDDDGEGEEFERRSKTQKHRRSRSGEVAGGSRGTDDYDDGYGGTGTAVPPPDGYRYYSEEPYSTEQDPYPPWEASSSSEFEYETPPRHSGRHGSRSSRNKLKSAKSSRHKESRSTSPHRSKAKSKEGKKEKKSTGDMVLHNLPGLITRAAFIVELAELNKKHKEGSGMAAKFALLLMGMKMVKQLRREHRAMNERREG